LGIEEKNLISVIASVTKQSVQIIISLL